jgi:superfamily II DNA or RNA helicase
MRSQQSAEGRAAFSAYRHQRKIALTSRAKLEELWRILVEHREDRSIVFTEDNETVYELARRLLAPAITHQTKPKERRRILDAFSAGELRVLLTSRVLNEGVDVPDANVGVILSGSGSVREHVQRLGRILRKRPDKRALLYEVLTDVAAESGISQRRRQHRAYQRSS